RVLRDRRVAHALLAELVQQPFGDLEGALEDPDVLAHDEDALVSAHLLGEGLVEGLAHPHQRQGALPLMLVLERLAPLPVANGGCVAMAGRPATPGALLPGIGCS